MSEDWYYTVRVDSRGWPDPDVGPDGPLGREEALAQQTGPDPHSMWRTIALRAVGTLPPCECIPAGRGFITNSCPLHNPADGLLVKRPIQFTGLLSVLGGEEPGP